MRKLITGALTAASLIAPVAVVAGPADAEGTPGCITRDQFASLHKGMTRSEVTQVTEARGTRVHGVSYSTSTGDTRAEARQLRAYTPCQPAFHVTVSYAKQPGGQWQVDGKRAVVN